MRQRGGKGRRLFQPGGPGGPGRPRGAKNKLPTIRRVYETVIAERDGHQKMVDAVDEGLQSSKRALGYLELGARVLDRVDTKGGNGVPVTILFVSNIRPERLRAAAGRARQPALRPPDGQA